MKYLLIWSFGEDTARPYEILVTENFKENVEPVVIKFHKLDENLFGGIGKGYKVIY
ncbi:MAG: hypothetical protein ACP5KG_11365 [Myxococcota bacterium]